MNMYPWQKEILKKMSGIKKEEMVIFTAGRNVGKSTFSAQAMKRLMDGLINRPVEELVLSEGTVYGSRYYCVEPIGGNWKKMESWAIRTYGPVSSVWRADKWVSEPNGRWYMNDRKFWFHNEQDRLMFVMKWR